MRTTGQCLEAEYAQYHAPSYKVDNPHYLAFCKVHGHTPEEQHLHDWHRWPGGLMCGFLLWMNLQKREFYLAHPEHFMDPHTICAPRQWSAWLASTTKRLDA